MWPHFLFLTALTCAHSLFTSHQGDKGEGGVSGVDGVKGVKGVKVSRLIPASLVVYID